MIIMVVVVVLEKAHEEYAHETCDFYTYGNLTL
jgi:hypothetical protein